MHTPRPRSTTVRQRSVRGGTVLAGNREPREGFVNLVRRVCLLVRPVLCRQRHADLDDRRKIVRSEGTRFEESLAVVVLLRQPCAHGGPVVGEDVLLAGRRGGRVLP